MREFSLKLLYVGNDNEYFELLKAKFMDNYPGDKHHYHIISKENPRKVKTVLRDIIQNNYNLIFIDFSSHPPEKLRLAYYLRAERSLSDIAIVGLHSQLKTNTYLRLSLALGVHFNFIKSIEFSSIIHHSVYRVFSGKAKVFSYATSKKKVEVFAVSKHSIGYLTDQYIHIESDFPFDGKELTELQIPIDMSFISAGLYRKVRTLNYNLYSHHNTVHDFEYVHDQSLESLRLEEKLSLLGIALKNDKTDKDSEYDLMQANSELEIEQKKLKSSLIENPVLIQNWIKENVQLSRPKRAKLLIIDNAFSLLDNIDKYTDSFPFSLKFQHTLDAELMIVETLAPGIIAYCLDKEINTFDQLPKLVEKLAQSHYVNPFLILFNTEQKEEDIKKILNYEFLLVFKDQISFEMIQSFSKKYIEMKGRQKTHSSELSFGDKETRHYLSKYNLNSLASFRFSIEITALNESELYFISSETIPEGSSLYLKHPVKMTITVMPLPAKTKLPALESSKKFYYALISGLGEMEVAGLRRKINDFVFEEQKEDCV